MFHECSSKDRYTKIMKAVFFFKQAVTPLWGLSIHDLQGMAGQEQCNANTELNSIESGYVTAELVCFESRTPCPIFSEWLSNVSTSKRIRHVHCAWTVESKIS